MKEPLHLDRGSRVGPYEIIAPLGGGGMGEVYRARDTRLGRSVAIKVIATEMAATPDRQIRFRREAKAISALRHPNICALYDIGELGDESSSAKRPYIVMEYLEGETLEDRLRKNALPLDQVLRYSLQIAEAVETAHRQQILHRDLKPSNIMLTRTGACLFDFGLAKSLDRSPPSSDSVEESSEPENPTSTAEKPITVEGAVVGTLEYLAPEQLEGREPDTGTDIYAFGVCLYQMITGKKPFQAHTRASLIAAILGGAPPRASRFRREVPASLDWLIEKCLTRDRSERMQSMHDVRLELQRIADELGRPVSKLEGTFGGRWVYLSAALSVVLLLIVIALTLRETRTTGTRRGPPPRRFVIALSATAPVADGEFEKIAVSPDGGNIAYVGGKEPTRLYLYSMDRQETKALAGTEGARGPFFSPDGQWIGFYTVDQGVQKVPVSGGTPVLLSSNRDLRGAAWGPDDTIVFADLSSALRRIPASGGHSEVLYAADPRSTSRWPWFLGSGKDLLYTIGQSSGTYEDAKLAIWSAGSKSSKTVLDRGTYGRYSSGYLLYLHSQTVFAVPFDVGAMRVTGSPIPVVTDIDSYFGTGLAHFAVSSDGSIFYIPHDTSASEGELVWVDRTGREMPVTSMRRAYEEAKISPDGKRLLVTIGPSPREDLWIYDIARQTWTRVTSVGTNQQGTWSPDGREIAFASNAAGGFGLYVVAADGSSPPALIAARQGWDFPWSWSPDGTAIAVTEYYQPTFDDIFLVTPKPGAVPKPLIATSADERDPAFSPDGRWIAYRSNQSGRDEIYVTSRFSSGRKVLISTDGGTDPVWRKDGRELFYRNGQRVMSVAISLMPDLSVGQPHLLFQGAYEEHYDVTPDGRRFVFAKRPPQQPRTQIKAVLNLLENLRPGQVSR